MTNTNPLRAGIDPQAELGLLVGWRGRGIDLDRASVWAALPEEVREHLPAPPGWRVRFSRTRDGAGRQLPPASEVAASIGRPSDGVRWSWSQHRAGQRGRFAVATSLRLDHPEGDARAAHPLAVVGIYPGDHDLIVIEPANGVPVPAAVETALQNAWEHYRSAVTTDDLVGLCESTCRAAGGMHSGLGTARWVPPRGASLISTLRASLSGLNLGSFLQVATLAGSSDNRQLATSAATVWLDAQLSDYAARVAKAEATAVALANGGEGRGHGKRPVGWAADLETLLSEGQHLSSCVDVQRSTLEASVRGVQKRCAELLGLSLDDLLTQVSDDGNDTPDNETPNPTALVDLDAAPF